MRKSLEYLVYQWKIQSIRQEVVENFPLLRKVKCHWLLRAIEYLDSLSCEERIQTLQSFVRRGTDIEVLQRFGIDRNEIDESGWQKLRDYDQQKTYAIYLKSLSLTKNGLDRELTPKIVKEASGIPDIPRATFSRLRSKIRKPLISLLGKPEDVAGSDLTFRTKINENIILSSHFYSGGYKQINMSQRIILLPITANEEQLPILVDMASRIGLGLGGATSWDLLTIEDYDTFQKIVISWTNELLKSMSVLFNE